MIKKKDKAIMGIVLAAIMLASVFAVLAPTSARDPANGDIEWGDIVYRGERGLDVSIVIPRGGTFYGIKDSTADGAQLTVSNNKSWNVPYTAKIGPYNISSREDTTADIVIDAPEITGGVYLAGTTDSVVGKSVPVGTVIDILAEPNFGGIMLNAYDGTPSKIKVKLDEPGGADYEYLLLVHATSQSITVTNTTWGSNAPTLDTTNWDTGTWKVKISTDKTSCNEVDISSPEYEFTVRPEYLKIEVEKDKVIKGDDIRLTVTGNYATYYYLIVTDLNVSAPPAIYNTPDVKVLDTAGDAYPATGTPNLAAWIRTGGDCIADVIIDTCGADTRTYTIKVYETITPVYPNFVPDANVTSTRDDAVKVTVVPVTVTFDVQPTAIIGEVVEIKGAINAGDTVDIVIKDELVVKNDKAVDENNEFSVDWDTGGFFTGSYTIEGYIDFLGGPALSDYVGVDPDGYTTIQLIEPGLNATQLQNFVAEGDDYSFAGTATGVDDIDYILVGPLGWKTGHAADILGGIFKGSASVTDSAFSEDITMTEGLDMGVWVTVALSPGRDGVYQTGEPAGDLTLSALGVTEGRNQKQILEIIEDKITEAGSDDLMKTLSFEVEPGYVQLDPVVSVITGEPLHISGVTNREPGTMVVIYTIEGPVHLPAAVAAVEWPTPDQGVFNATIDTTDAEPGNYTLRADDGEGNTDTVTVEIRGAIPIFDTRSGTYPSIAGMHNGTISPFYDLNVSKLYTYPCAGTGGHTEYVRLWNSTLDESARWNGYTGDWNSITFDESFMLCKNRPYNYTIVTGSYPQIIHEHSKDVIGGTITCIEFVDANGKTYTDWIPAFRLE